MGWWQMENRTVGLEFFPNSVHDPHVDVALPIPLLSNGRDLGGRALVHSAYTSGSRQNSRIRIDNVRRRRAVASLPLAPASFGPCLGLGFRSFVLRLLELRVVEENVIWRFQRRRLALNPSQVGLDRSAVPLRSDAIPRQATSVASNKLNKLIPDYKLSP